MGAIGDINGSNGKGNGSSMPHDKKLGVEIVSDSSPALKEVKFDVKEDKDKLKKDDEPVLEEDNSKPASLIQMFRYANWVDYLLLFIGVVMGLGNGITMPLFSIVLGGLFDAFNFLPPGKTTTDVAAEYAIQFLYLGLAAFIASFCQMGMFTIVSERQAIRIRKHYLDAVLNQDISWFDNRQSGDLSAKISENTVIIRESIGDKLGNLFQFLAMFIGGFAVGFVYSWKLTLVVCSLAPFLALGGYVMMQVMADLTGQGLNSYAKSGAIAAEALANIRTVLAFGAQKNVQKNYDKNLADAERNGIKKAWSQGLGMGFTMLVMFACYGLAFAYGSILVEKDRDEYFSRYPDPDFTNPGCVPLESTPFGNLNDYCSINPACGCGCNHPDASCLLGGDVVLVFFSVIMGSFAIGQAAPSMSTLKNGQVSAGKIYSIIDRTPAINLNSDSGIKPKLTGRITLENVFFEYPTRPDVKIFKGINLEIPAGKTVALVGGSGCGKSTVVALVQRFYDVRSGLVRIDEHDIKTLNLSYLRNQIGLVGQEPVLFATSIARNISYGAESGRECTKEEIINAAKAANAYDFIMGFPQQFDTLVGERGAQLSGGQKQRIAIARAILRDPMFLLLDEATSALDNESEKIVQKALDDLLTQKKRTTIVIAHRLSTVRNADKIVVLGGGNVLEEGTHEELLRMENGAYSMLVAAANKSQEGHGQTSETAPADDINHLLDRVSANQGFKDSASKLSGNASKLLRDSKNKTEKFSSKVGSSFEKGEDKAKEGDKEAKEELYSVPIRRIFTYSRPELLWYIPGLISAVLNGAQMPVFSILFGEIATVFYEPTEEMRDGARNYALAFVGLGIVAGLSNFGQFYAFGTIAEKLTRRVRSVLLYSILRQEVGFFDDEKNSIGKLTAGLATDAALVKAVIADRLGLGVMNLVTAVSGLTIAFVKGWKLTLVLIAAFPLIAGAGALQMIAMTGFSKQDDKYMAPAAQILQESISGIRTVTAFNSREKIVKLYAEYLEVPNRLGTKKGLVGGLGFGVSNAVIFLVYAAAFYYGGVLIDRGEYTFQDMLIVFFAIVMTAMGLGQSVSMTPDIAKGGVAVSNVFKIVDRKSKIDPTSNSGITGSKNTPDINKIAFQGVSFAYPARPDAKIFENLNLTIEPGTTVALVGSSGSGKSTIVSLLERFYDPSSGTVGLDDIKDLKLANVNWLRNQVGLVEQEPRLFATTIRENIAYGLASTLEELSSVEGKQREISDNEIIEAAKAANAHDFIMSFPKGYDTMVGDQGAQLSGGQKQRICIARAIIRKPRILLLDEATSALDNESERVVQKALDELVGSKKLTTVVVAHRLTTVQNADKIVVMSYGKVVEMGKHEELLALKGAYSKLWYAQQKQGH